MKAIKMQIQKSSRWLVILLATVVAILTSIVVANATQTITTPNAAFITYSLAANGGTSAAITPASNKSVLVMGCSTTSGDVGVGQVSLAHFPSIGIAWVGLQGTNGATTHGFSGTPGSVIVSVDGGGFVHIRTASADTIVIENDSTTGVRTGNVTLIW
jgi:hypothetical protein